MTTLYDTRFTHKINLFGSEIRCFIMKNIPETDGEVYIKTEDGRAFWTKKDDVISIR